MPESKSNTVLDVARLAGVSVATVSRVFTGKANVNKSTREKVMKAADQLNFRPNRVARRLRLTSAESLVLGLVIPDFQNPFFSELARGVEDFAYNNRNAVMICNTDEDAEKEEFYIETLKSERVSGFIIAQAPGPSEKLGELIKSGYPVVGVDRLNENLKLDTVTTDNEYGAATAVRHLTGFGHKRIGIINSLPGISTTHERMAGYEKALREAGIELVEHYICYGDARQESGAAATRKLLGLTDRPTAIFSTNNLMTLGCLEAIHESGLRIPDDISVIGFDDMPWAVALNPPLTAISQPAYEMGFKAAELLLRRIEKPDSAPGLIKLQPSLISRKSCGPAQEF